MGIVAHPPLSVIPGGNLLRTRHALPVTTKIPSGNDTEGELTRYNNLFLQYRKSRSSFDVPLPGGKYPLPDFSYIGKELPPLSLYPID